jgi:hypothetical protein
MDDDTKNKGNKRTTSKDHGRDPRYLDLVATILLFAVVGTMMVVITRGFTVEPIHTVGVDQYVRW